MHPDDIKIASIVKAELLYGAEKSLKKEDNRMNVLKFLLPFDIVSFDDKATEKYSIIRAGLEKAGMQIGPNDLILSTVVLANESILVTNNEKEFKGIPELNIKNWISC